MSKIYKFKFRSGWGSYSHVFGSIDDLLKYLCRNFLSIYEYEIDSEYEATKDLGHPFPYWEKGTKMSLKEWVSSSRKEILRLKDWSDEEIILSILEKDHLWRKV